MQKIPPERFCQGTCPESEKIQTMQEMFDLTRFVKHMDVGEPPHLGLMKAVQLFGKKVIAEIA